MCYYQSRRRHDYPPIKSVVLSNLPPILTNGGFVVDRKSADLLTTSI